MRERSAPSLNWLPYMAGNRVSTKGHDIINTHYVIGTWGSYKGVNGSRIFQTSASCL